MLRLDPKTAGYPAFSLGGDGMVLELSWNKGILRIFSRTRTYWRFALDTEASDAPETCDPEWAFFCRLEIERHPIASSPQLIAPPPSVSPQRGAGIQASCVLASPCAEGNEESGASVYLCPGLPLDFAVRPQATPAWAWFPTEMLNTDQG